MEEWRDINGFEGYYQVSNKGNVRSLDRFVVASKNGTLKLVKGKSMKLTKAKGRNNDGYLVVNLRRERTNKVSSVHVLVANAFLDKVDGRVVNHIDGNKYNNNVTNLEWCSYSHNNIHALENGLRNPRGTSIDQLTLNDEFIHTYKSGAEAARLTNISAASISHCLKGRTKSAGGYKWVYSK